MAKVAEPMLDIDMIQGNVIPGFRLPYQQFLGFRVNDAGQLNSILKFLRPSITTMRQALSFKEERLRIARIKGIISSKESFNALDHASIYWLNVALSQSTMRKFTTDADTIDTSFQNGLWSRSTLLGDSSDPQNEGNRRNWIFGNENDELDVFLIMGSDRKEYLQAKVSDQCNGLIDLGVKILYSEFAERLENDVEHFGFKDGISQPGIRGYIENQTFLTEREVVTGNENENSPEYAYPGKMLLWPGQFVFGYPKQSPHHFRIPLEASPAEKSTLIKNGSYLVFRKLKQDVQSFIDQTKKAYDDLITTPGFEQLTYDDFIAQLVGRHKDGKPLLYESSNEDDFNNFNYSADTKEFKLTNGHIINSVAADPTGFKCPMFAHIRKVNPRDLATDQGAETNTATFRIIRRGIPFGPPFNPVDINSKENSEERGLFFLSYQTSISNQFELLTSKWMNEDSRPEAKAGHDIIMGQNAEEDEMGIKWCLFKNQSGNSKRLDFRPFVTPKAGQYFFCPSLEAIEQMVIDFPALQSGL